MKSMLCRTVCVSLAVILTGLRASIAQSDPEQGVLIGSGPPDDVESFSLNNDGLIEGEYKRWAGASLLIRAHLTNGILDGEYEYLGYIPVTGAYERGKKTGTWVFGPTNKPVRIEQFKNGRPIKVWQWFDAKSGKL